MKIGILTTNQFQDDKRLIEAATEKGHSASLLDLRDVSIDLSPDFTSIYYRNKDITREFDAIIPRLNVSFTDYGINILKQFMCANTYVSESPNALRLGRDKLKCLQVLFSKRLPFPGTGIAYSCDNFASIISRLKFPLVIKLIESTEGIGVFLAKNQLEAENIIKTFSLLRAPFLVQEFIAEAEGQDFRAFVVGDRVVAAMKRTSKGEDFRA
ncbi:MAG: ribosomal protein S6--L-glutamate ligase, partial [Glaciecola sp.]